jgi:hypothetical protein
MKEHRYSVIHKTIRLHGEKAIAPLSGRRSKIGGWNVKPTVNRDGHGSSSNLRLLNGVDDEQVRSPREVITQSELHIAPVSETACL